MTDIHRFLRGLTTSLVFFCGALAAGCVGDTEEEGWQEGDDIGQATFEVKAVPSGVTCIRISVVGTTTVTKDFGQLAVGAPTTTLNMDRLPLGTVAISAMAFATSATATSCTANQTPLWIADAVTTLLEPGVVSKLDLTFRKNNPVTASVNFVGNIQALAAGGEVTLLLADGQVYQWGTSSSRMVTPTLVSGLSNVIAVTAGSYYGCALRDDGTIWCWGSSSSLIGTSGSAPVQLATGRTYTAIDGGQAHVCGVSGDSAYCWGENYEGELVVNPATTTSVPHTSPINVGTVGPVLDAGHLHICQIAMDLDVRCVGDNNYGALGRTTSTEGVYAWGDATESSPAVGLASGYRFTLAAMADGSVRAAGFNPNGQLGRGNTTSDDETATELTAISGLTNVRAVAAGDHHSLALRADGSVRAWGDNASGQLGDATNTDRLTPVTVSGLPPTRLIAAGDYHSCAVTQDERVFCWGSGSGGALGNGTRNSSATPQEVVLP